MRVQCLNHVAYRCRDAKETVEFYTDILGLKLAHTITQDRVPSTQELAPHAHVFFEMADGSWVAFFDLADEPVVEQEKNPDWAQHLALEVESVEDLEAARQNLIDNDIDVLGRTPGEVHCHAARIGEHSEQILREFGFSDEEIAGRIASGAVHVVSD